MTEYTSNTIQVGNVMVTIHRPILTDSERLQAEDLIRNALVNFGRAMESMKWAKFKNIFVIGV